MLVYEQRKPAVLEKIICLATRNDYSDYISQSLFMCVQTNRENQAGCWPWGATAAGIIIITANYYGMRIMGYSSWLEGGQMKVNQWKESNLVNQGPAFVAETGNIAGFITILGREYKYGEFQ